MTRQDSTRDDARPVRPEDAFDVAALHRWLAARMPGVGTALPQVRQFAGGASNLTYLLHYREHDLVLRRPPAGTKAAGAHDMRREHRVQDALAPHFPFVPQMVALCEDPAVLGSEFYVMQRVPGRILRGQLPADLALSPQDAAALGEHAVDTLVALHAVDIDTAGLRDLGRGAGYVARQVEGWTKRYAAARTQDVPDFAPVTRWLAAEQPADVATCLLHNDFRLDNLVLDEQLHVRALLDWEMATLGDPLMDLGGALAYWVQADDEEGMQLSKRQPTDLPGMPTRAQVVARYAQRSGLPVDGWLFYEVFGLFRLAVIVQQIYLRYVRGQTTNERFAGFGLFATYLESRCRALAGV